MKPTIALTARMQSPITWYGYRAIEKKGLVGPVEARWKALLVEIATQYGLEKLAVEGMPDHGHRLVSAPPKFAAAEMVCLFQGITSRRWKKEFESLHRPYVEEHATLWAEGYY